MFTKIKHKKIHKILDSDSTNSLVKKAFNMVLIDFNLS